MGQGGRGEDGKRESENVDEAGHWWERRVLRLAVLACYRPSMATVEGRTNDKSRARECKSRSFGVFGCCSMADQPSCSNPWIVRPGSVI
jgi:hypothetical protein